MIYIRSLHAISEEYRRELQIPPFSLAPKFTISVTKLLAGHNRANGIVEFTTRDVVVLASCGDNWIITLLRSDLERHLPFPLPPLASKYILRKLSV